MNTNTLPVIPSDARSDEADEMAEVMALAMVPECTCCSHPADNNRLGMCRPCFKAHCD